MYLGGTQEYLVVVSYCVSFSIFESFITELPEKASYELLFFM